MRRQAVVVAAFLILICIARSGVLSASAQDIEKEFNFPEMEYKDPGIAPDFFCPAVIENYEDAGCDDKCTEKCKEGSAWLIENNCDLKQELKCKP